MITKDATCTICVDATTVLADELGMDVHCLMRLPQYMIGFLGQLAKARRLQTDDLWRLERELKTYASFGWQFQWHKDPDA